MEQPGDVLSGIRMLRDGCTKMGSPLYGALFAQAASAYERGGTVRRLLDRHAGRAHVGLLLTGAAHFRALSGDAPRVAAHLPSTGGDADPRAAWDAIVEDVEANEALYDRLLAMTVQTNEVARALPLLAGMLAVSAATALPLRIFEIGSSAGFLLNLDRYRYEGEGWVWGAPDAQLTLRDRSGARPANIERTLAIVERRGCDLHPLDVRADADANRLLSFVWPDQIERFERVRRAIAVARRFPPALDRADGIEWVSEAASPRSGACTVVFHSVMAEHLTHANRARLNERLRVLGESAGAGGPFAHVRMESQVPGGRFETCVTLWPGQRETIVARSDGHAQRLEWVVAVA